MCITAAILGAGALAAGATAYAANKASDAQEEATKAQESGIDAQLQMYYEDVERRKPFYETGLAALPMLKQFATGRYDVTEDPAYATAESSLLRRLEKNLAAKGLQFSGAGVQGMSDVLTGLQLGMRTQRFNEAGTIANLGQSGFAQSPNLTGAYAALGQTYANDPTASIIMGGLATGVQGYSNYQLMNRLYPQPTTTTPSPLTYTPTTLQTPSQLSLPDLYRPAVNYGLSFS